MFVGVCPRVRQAGTADAVERAWCLWCDLDTDDAARRLDAFQPAPSIVIRSGTGSHRHAYWALRDPVASTHVARANRRLALALGGDRASCDPARIMRPAGTFNYKRQPRRAVECVRCEPAVFTVREVIGGLPDDRRDVPKRPLPQIQAATPGAILDGLARTVCDAPIGERNSRLNWAAYRAGEHAHDGKLSPAEAQTVLLNAAISAGLDETEAQRTIRSGLDAAQRAAA